VSYTRYRHQSINICDCNGLDELRWTIVRLLLRCAGHRPRQSVVVSLSTCVSVSTVCARSTFLCPQVDDRSLASEVCWAQASPWSLCLQVCPFPQAVSTTDWTNNVTNCSLVCEVCWAQASPGRAGLSVWMCVRFHRLRMSIFLRLQRHVCLFPRSIFLRLQRPGRTQVTYCSLASEVCWETMCVRFHRLRAVYISVSATAWAN
jgi:hypothetical protein